MKNGTAKKGDFCTREGREIFRIKKVHLDGISGEFECIYSNSPLYVVGEVEINIMDRYDRITDESFPDLSAVIKEKFSLIELSYEEFKEVIRQAHCIGLTDRSVSLRFEKPGELKRRVDTISRDINREIQAGRLEPFDYNKHDEFISRTRREKSEELISRTKPQDSKDDE